MTATFTHRDVTTAIDAINEDWPEFGLGVVDLDSDDDHLLIASKGALGLHALRRRHGKGWRYLGYAVWCCRCQAWVRGSWSRPENFGEAIRYMGMVEED